MARGGRRQGTPGKGYANRSDLAVSRDMSQNTAATGGMQPPTGGTPSPPQGALPVSDGQTGGVPAFFRGPDDSPNLTDPTQRPGEPLTSGLSSGPGPGPEAITQDTRAADTAKLRKWLPILALAVEKPDTPVEVKNLYQYVKGF